MNKLYLPLTICLLCLNSCNVIFNSTLLPNHCKKCEVVNKYNDEVLFTNEGCGGENTKLEEEAQIQAYLLSHGYNSNLCDLEVKCISWKKLKDEK